MAENLNIPNFFIVGAAKAGTTSVYHYLSQHQNVYASPIKEPNYFAQDIDTNNFTKAFKQNIPNTESYFNKTHLASIQQAFITNSSDYNLLFKNAKNEKILFEASTSYLFSSVAAENIFQFNPKAKILVILRDPIKRCYSHYLMALRFGFTSLSFKKAIELDNNVSIRNVGQSELFIDMSLYNKMLLRYQKVFDARQIKIMFFEDLVERPLDFMNELADFLEIEKFKEISSEPKNTAEVPRNIKLNKFIVQSGIKKSVLKILPEKIINALKKAYINSKADLSISKSDYEFIFPFIKSDLEQLKKNNPELRFPW